MSSSWHWNKLFTWVHKGLLLLVEILELLLVSLGGTMIVWPLPCQANCPQEKCQATYGESEAYSHVSALSWQPSECMNCPSRLNPLNPILLNFNPITGSYITAKIPSTTYHNINFFSAAITVPPKSRSILCAGWCWIMDNEHLLGWPEETYVGGGWQAHVHVPRTQEYSSVLINLGLGFIFLSCLHFRVHG